jgi:hypothetical protein
MPSLLRYTVLGISSAAMGFGILVIAGLLVPQNLPEQFRVIAGSVVFLYGLYRFVVAYIKKPDSRRHDEL